MVKLVFAFNEEKDLWNNWDTVNYNSPWEPGKSFNKIPLLEKICKERTFEACKNELKNFYKVLYQTQLIKEIEKSFQNAWNKINDEYFKRLEKLTGNKFPFEKVTVYLTTQLRCPYNVMEGSFFVSIFSNIPSALKTCGHELMHLDFHKNNWAEIEKQIGKEKTSDLKEAITVLLNVEFRDLWFVKDKGKSNKKQQELRNFIKEKWKVENNFNRLLRECIGELKNA